ncbi:hypothetical protein FOWG_16268 [Fusarium oxysporum f. sp. lycopersici MN25]|nr:hypothetical protein FOWG_16268 [Fusarium oxysporum f. sp. lycopersici MN25]
MERMGMLACSGPATTICSTSQIMPRLRVSKRAIKSLTVLFLRKPALLTLILWRLFVLRSRGRSITSTHTLVGRMGYSCQWRGLPIPVQTTRLSCLQLHLAGQNKLGMTSDRCMCSLRQSSIQAWHPLQPIKTL